MNGRGVTLYTRPLGLDGPWQDERCGTYAGWNAHNQCGEEPCVPCKSAHAAYARQRRIRTGQTRHMVSVTEAHRQEALRLCVSSV